MCVCVWGGYKKHFVDISASDSGLSLFNMMVLLRVVNSQYK